MLKTIYHMIAKCSFLSGLVRHRRDLGRKIFLSKIIIRRDANINGLLVKDGESARNITTMSAGGVLGWWCSPFRRGFCCSFRIFSSSTYTPDQTTFSCAPLIFTHSFSFFHQQRQNSAARAPTVSIRAAQRGLGYVKKHELPSSHVQQQGKMKKSTKQDRCVIIIYPYIKIVKL